MSVPTADGPIALLRGASGLALLGTAAAVGQHLSALAPADPVAWGWSAVHVAGALLALTAGQWLFSRAHPTRRLTAIAAGNPAAAIKVTAHHLAAAAIAGACWGGTDGGSAVVALVFTLVAWSSLLIICAGHRVVTRYADHEEIAAGNVAAALASAGLHLAVALVVVRALQGPFLGWGPSLAAYGWALAWVLVLYPLRQVVVARLILRLDPKAMDQAVAARQAVWIGAVEGLGYLLTALAVASAW